MATDGVFTNILMTPEEHLFERKLAALQERIAALEQCVQRTWTDVTGECEVGSDGEIRHLVKRDGGDVWLLTDVHNGYRLVKREVIEDCTNESLGMVKRQAFLVERRTP